MNETQNTQSQTFVAWIQATPFRQNLAVLIFAFAALAMIAKTVLLFRQASHVGRGDNYPQSIVVTGKAETYVKPDTLQFSITVNEDGKDVSEATTKVNEKIEKAIAILKAHGVEDKNIKTTNWTSSDKYESVTKGCADVSYNAVPMPVAQKGVMNMRVSAPSVPCQQVTSEIVGATVYQTLEVKIRDIEKNATAEKRGKLIADLAGANIKTDSFTFTVFDIDAVKKDVREEAIANAKADAKVLARDLGVDLGGITGFSEDAGGYNPYMSARSDSMMASGKELSVVPMAQLPTGEEKVVSMVTVTYLLK